MTIEELLEKIEEATGFQFCEDVDLDGQVILFTGLTEDEFGELIEHDVRDDE